MGRCRQAGWRALSTSCCTCDGSHAHRELIRSPAASRDRCRRGSSAYRLSHPDRRALHYSPAHKRVEFLEVVACAAHKPRERNQHDKGSQGEDCLNFAPREVVEVREVTVLAT